MLFNKGGLGRIMYILNCKEMAGDIKTENKWIKNVITMKL